MAYVFLFLALVLLSIFSLCFGAADIPLEHLYGLLPFDLFFIGDAQSAQALSISQYVIMDIRLPRLITTCLVGVGLAAAGVSTQALFRNPLADPALIGVSNGAAVGAVSVIVLGASISPFVSLSVALPVAAFFAGIIATMIAVSISTYQGRSDTTLLLLSGVAINAIAGAFIGLLTYIADDNQLRDLTFWTMGSTAKSGWSELLVAVPLIGISCLMLMRYRKVLNCFLLGEQVTEQVGYDVSKIKLQIIILNTIIVGAAVSISGVIFFIGLVVPHLIRLCCGPDHQRLLPLSMLTGAVLLLLADNIARSVVSPAEMPIGLIMSVIGGPFFIYLLLQQKKQRVV